MNKNSNNSTRIVVFRIFSAAMFKFLDADNSFSQTRSNSFTLGCLIGTISNSQVNDSELYKRILTLYNIRFSSVSVHAYTSIYDRKYWKRKFYSAPFLRTIFSFCIRTLALLDRCRCNCSLAMFVKMVPSVAINPMELWRKREIINYARLL